MNAVLSWILANPKMLTVVAGLVVSLIEVWRQRSKGKATRAALDLVNNELREQGFLTAPELEVATEALQSRSRKKAAALRELRKSNIRLDANATAAWVREQVKQMEEKKR